jgi:hypothetical protein
VEEEVSIPYRLPTPVQDLREERYKKEMIKPGTKIGLLLSIE